MFFRIGYLFLLFFLAGCDEVILHNLSEEQVNSARVTLAEHSIEASKVKTASGWNLAVSQDKATTALKIVSENRVIPRKGKAPTPSGSSFVLSKEERLLMRERHIAGALEETLLRIPGVLESRVHLFLEAKPAFAMRQKSSAESASVLLVVREGLEIDSSLVKELVSGASGVGNDSVRVMLTTEQPSVESASLKGVKKEFPSNHDVARTVLDTFSASYNLVVPGILFLALTGMFYARRRAFKEKEKPDGNITLRPPEQTERNGIWREEAF